MPEYGLIPTSRSRDRTLAQCGILAGLLWAYGRPHADAYGRLEASPTALADTALRGWVAVGTVDELQIAEARNRLVQAGLWHYWLAGDREYVEYIGWDGEQAPSHLERRAYRPTHPDDPKRPELWARNRTHRKPKRYEQDEPTENSQPHGSADLPAEPAKATGVPTSGADAAKPAEVPSSDEREEFIREGVRQLARAQEQHGGAVLGPADHQKLRAVMEDAWDAQVPWQTLLTIMREKQTAYEPTRTEPKIKRIGYYQGAWDAHIREAKREGSKPLRSSPPPVPPPDDEEDEIAARVRAQNQALVNGHATAV